MLNKPEERSFCESKMMRHSDEAKKFLVDFFKEFDRIMGSEIGEDEDESD